MQNNLDPNNRSGFGDDNQYNQVSQKRQLDKGQKIAVAALALLAVFVFSFWIMDARKGLRGSTKISPQAVDQTETCSGGNCNNTSVDLKLKDTDHDGLSDYDELNIYGTSPYLEDSDSDGYSDSKEVSSSNDPNCPVGVTCSAQLLPVTETQPVLGDSPGLRNPQTISQPIEVGSDEKVLQGAADASSLRQLLIKQGMDPSILNQISDQELITTYKDILGS